MKRFFYLVSGWVLLALALAGCGASAARVEPNLEVVFSGSGACDEVQVSGRSLGTAILRSAGEVRRFAAAPGEGVQVACLRHDAPPGFVYLKPAEAPEKPVRVGDTTREASGLFVEPEVYSELAYRASLPARPFETR